jgi:hypothetical protein
MIISTSNLKNILFVKEINFCWNVSQFCISMSKLSKIVFPPAKYIVCFNVKRIEIYHKLQRKNHFHNLFLLILNFQRNSILEGHHKSFYPPQFPIPHVHYLQNRIVFQVLCTIKLYLFTALNERVKISTPNIR